MISMILYGISILFSPGPVTLVALNKGLRKQFNTSFGYFVSIGVATYLLLIIYGFTGQKLIKKEYLTYIGILGCLYMFRLSYQMFNHSVNLNEKHHKTLGFKEGFLMQFLNPKASLATLPIATIQYPMNDISGISILWISLIFLTLGIFSPALYCFVGQYSSKYLVKGLWINRFNKGMALLLSGVALIILIESFS